MNRVPLTFLSVALIGCAASRSTPRADTPPGETVMQATEPRNPARPRPVLPEVAFMLGDYANLELGITAARDGSIRQVTIARPSQAKLYDEYTRAWVEKHWTMPAAKPGEPELRQFIAPIIYPHGHLPVGGSFPPPPYPGRELRDRTKGIVVLAIDVDASGQVQEAKVVVSSGHKSMDESTANWVQKRWKFPSAGKAAVYTWPVAYLIR